MSHSKLGNLSTYRQHHISEIVFASWIYSRSKISVFEPWKWFRSKEMGVPYELKLRDVERRFFACEQLLQRQNRQGFLHRIVTGDEKCVHYDNPKRRKSWVMPRRASTSTARLNIHGVKIMLCIWWDRLGLLYYELLTPSETITGNRYRTKLILLIRALKEKRPQYQETRQSYPPAWQYSATCRKTGQKILGNAEMEGLTPPAVLSRRCFFRIPFVSFDGTRPGSSAFPLLWRHQIMYRFGDHL